MQVVDRRQQVEQQRKHRWEIDQKSNELRRVRAKDSEAIKVWDDYKQVLELGAKKMGIDVSAKGRAIRARRRKKNAERKRRRMSADGESSSAGGLQPKQRRRKKLERKVLRELRQNDKAVRVLKAFKPVFKQDSDALSGAVGKFAGMFHEVSKQQKDWKVKIAEIRAAVEKKRAVYEKLKKKRTRLAFAKLAAKAKREVARRKRRKEQDAKNKVEEDKRDEAAWRARLKDDEILDLMASNQQKQMPFLELAQTLDASGLIDSHAPELSRRDSAYKTQLETKLGVSDLIHGFLHQAPIPMVVGDIINNGVVAFNREQAKNKVIGDNPEFDAQFGTDFEENEFDGYTDEDVADMKPDQQTRFFAWRRWKQKNAEMQILMNMVEDDPMAVSPRMEESIDVPEEEEPDWMALLNDFGNE
jgi:hypothetical protein